MKDGFIVPVREKFAYGLGDLGLNVAYGALGFYFVFFLTDVAGVNPAMAGLVFLIGRLWNAMADSLSGVLSDRVTSRFGRRRPFLLFGALPLSVGFALLWVVPFTAEVQTFLFFTAVAILFNTMFSLVAVPYNSLLPELSQNYDERTSISGFKMGMSFVGTLVSAMGVTLIVDTIYPGKAMYTTSFPIMGQLLALIILITTIVTFLGTRERVAHNAPVKGNFKETVLSVFKLKEFRIITGIFLCSMIGLDIIMAMNIYFMKYIVKVSDELTFVFMAVPLVVAIAVTPLSVWAGKKLGKQKAYMFATVFFLLPLALCVFTPMDDLVFVVIVLVLLGAGLSAAQILTFSILPDVVEVDEHRNGIRREGAIYGIIMFFYKLGSAITIGLVSAALGLFGYLESTGGEVIHQPESALIGIRVLIGVVPAVFLVASAVFVKHLPIDRESFEAMKQDIAGRV